MRVSSDMPEDVVVLHDALARLRDYKKGEPLTLHLKNCGTALRFLQVHLAKCYPGEPITLTGDERLMERDGKPTSQTTSALILHGEDIPVEADESPYITMSRRMRELYLVHCPFVPETDWSAAAFWYEYVAIHGGELTLEGLKEDSLQGDRIVADIYAKYFGVTTEFVPEGAQIKKSSIINHQSPIIIDFTRCPDLYPAVALTCERLGIELKATGTERLRYKESDRLEAVRLHEVRNDHRMAMSLMVADYPVSIEEQACIAKSNPLFVEQFTMYNVQCTISHITPIKGVNDDHLGKKHALSKLIHAATSVYIWLHDDDIVWPKAANVQRDKVQGTKADLVILPLKMESENANPSLLERLQIVEYAAIQELTMRTAKKGRAVMCSGANLIVRREVWLACESEIHPEIPSGDDMFLLEAVKRHGYRVSVIDAPDYTAVVRPQTSWRAFFRQRMRWAGKAPHYTDRDILRCGALVTAAYVLQLVCPLFILITFPIGWALIRRRAKIVNRQSSNRQFAVSLLLAILYPYYMLVCLLGGLFRKDKW